VPARAAPTSCLGQNRTIAGYTITNLKDIENAAERGGMAPDLEARFARNAVGAEGLALSYQRLATGFRMPFGHRHQTQEEVYVVVGGSGRVKLDDEVVDVREWDVVRVPKETMRAFEAGPEGLELLAIGTPKTGPGDADVVQGWWDD
jgi:mannose-6-phosphate isomerase-like protein (cupin superfamily)